MGTLTAAVPQLAEHCSHKLASSCRLTSTPNCCACADNRPHNPTYRKYIDGVGYVQLGVRWDHYCWPCYSFWSVRVQQSGIPPRQTRIPDIPNQDEFTKRWLEFHQGYRVVKKPDGREEKIAVSGEPLKDVDPGVMPRTLDELRAGRLTGTDIAPVTENPPELAEVDSGPSLDEALDQLLGEALTEEGQEQSQTNREGEIEASSVATNVAQPSGEGSRPISTPIMTAVELAAVRHGIDQIRRQIEAEERDAEARLTQMATDAEELVQTQQRMEDYQRQAYIMRLRLARYERYIDNELAHSRAVGERISGREEAISHIGERLGILRHELRQYRQRAAGEGNFVRVFGTREDIQSEDYVSPITNMFTRVNEWGRRRQAQPTIPQDPIITGNQDDDSQGQGESGEAPVSIPVSRVTARRSERQDIAQRTERQQLDFSQLEINRDAVDAPQNPPQVDAPTLLASRGGPTQAAGAVSGTATSGDDPGSSLLTTLAGSDTHVQLDNSLPENTTPVVDFGEWLSERGYMPNTQVRNPENHTVPLTERNPLNHATALNLFQLPEFQASPPDLDPHVSSDDDDSLRLSARRERMRVEAMQQFQDRQTTAYDARRPHPFLTLSRAMRVPPTTPQLPLGLDIADERPEAKTDEEMTVKVECKVCLSQVADTACLPCGHLCMCSWCADQVVPVKKEDRTRPVRKGLKCPFCREKVKSRAKIFV